MSYEAFYGFGQSPFTLAPDPRFLYLSGSHEEAITLLHQALKRKEGFIVLTGDIGTGKTTICRALLQQLDVTTFTSLVLNPFLSVEELLREALLDFGVLSRQALRSGRIATASTHELVSTLHEFLLSLVPIRGSAVLIIDEAQHLSPQVLEQIRVLSNLETNEAKLLQIVLVGQLSLLDILGNAHMRQLDQRISIRAKLKPLNRDEVEAYISHRLTVAQSPDPAGQHADSGAAVSFERQALDLVHTYSGGVPRVINLLCDRTLMKGGSVGQYEMTPELVTQAAESLGLETLTPSSRLPLVGRLPRWAAAAFLALAAFIVLIVLLGAFMPLDTWIEAIPPSVPASPQPAVSVPAAAKPIPDATESLE